MSELSAGDFPQFFEQIHGFSPYPWQSRLAQQVLISGWPDLLDLPTGTGKTAALDIALFAMAVDAQAHPRRIVFVVDRRLIVDQVAERAQMIQTALQNALDSSADSTAGRVAKRLNSLSRARTIVGTSTLRGGLRDTEWARYPDAPWLISSTVDQVGSRLLFRGYGVSPRMRSVHAGLLGNDALFLLDEVHLSQPFAHTLSEIHQHHRNPGPIHRPWTVVQMSATAPDDEQEPFQLGPDDHSHPALGRIIAAKKPAKLQEVGKKSQRDPAVAISSAAVDLVRDLGDVDSVGFVVNRVRTARMVAQALADAGFDPLLLTGRMRPWDRAEVVESPRFANVRNNGSRSPTSAGDAPADAPVVVVATQTIEVGADLDFGALITECAPIDSIKQRLGRLDRSGSRAAEGTPAPAIVILPTAISAMNMEAPDPVYGPGMQQRVWSWLDQWLPLEQDPSFDVGLSGRALGNPPPEVCTPKQTAPLLLASHLSLLCQTMPSPAHDPEVHRWLHGETDPDTDIDVAWRADISPADIAALAVLDADEQHQRITAYLELAPVGSHEIMGIPIGAAGRWFQPRPNDPDIARSADIADVVMARDPEQPPLTTDTVAVRVSGTTRCVVSPADLRPGDRIIVPATAGGLAQRTWAPEATEPVEDVGDLFRPDGIPSTIRIVGFTADLSFDDATTQQQRLAALKNCLPEDGDDASLARGRIGALKALLSPADNAESASGPPPGDLTKDYELVHYGLGDRPTHVALRARTKPALGFDGSDAANSSTGTATTLVNHMNGVGSVASEFAHNLGLSSEMVEDLQLAGRLHDLGKIDPRFQLLLHNNDVFAAAAAVEPLAKSIPGRSRGPIRAKDRYPRQQRHELLSVALIDTHPELMADAHDADLVRYLIASHHGHNRPFVPKQDNTDAPPVTAEVLGIAITGTAAIAPELCDARTADLFWQMTKRFGHYGLAWMEAVFRLADHRQSEEEAETIREPANGNERAGGRT